MLRHSIKDEWARAGVPMNVVAPGVILTPDTEEYLNSENGQREGLDIVPMPLNGMAPLDVVADLLTWLTSEQNTHVTGQVDFVDGGAEAIIRGPGVFG